MRKNLIINYLTNLDINNPVSQSSINESLII